MTLKRKLLIIVLAGFIGSVSFGYYMYNKPHQDMSKAKAEYESDSKSLFAEFESNEQAANEKYLGKILEVTGVIQEVKSEEEGQKIILEGDGMMFGVIANMDELTTDHRSDFKTGETVTLKCECTGLLMDVVLKRCVEVIKK